MPARPLIAGYRYPEVSVGFIALPGESETERVRALKEAVASPVGVREAILGGREVHLFPKDTAEWGNAPSEYAFKADLSPAAVKAARALHRNATAQYPAAGVRDIIGLCKMGRMSPSGVLEATREVVLNRLDDGHVLDHLISAMVRWHAEVFGEGPHSPAGAARRAALCTAQHLDTALPAPQRPRSRSRV